MDQLKAADIMKSKVITVKADATVQELADLLTKKKISGVPVIDDHNRVLGIVSEGDLISIDADIHFPHYIELLGNIIYLESVKKYEERLHRAAATKVSDLMTNDVVSVQEDAPITEVATLMTDKQVNRVPVLNGDVLVGIIARADVVRAIAGNKV